MGAAPLHLRRYGAADRAAVIELWERSGLTRPWNDPGSDIDRKLAHDGTILVAEREDEDQHEDDHRSIVGTVMAGYDGHRGWLNYVAVDAAVRRTGIGRLLVEAAERHLAALGCPKVNLQIRHDNPAAVAFYEQLGYVLDDVAGMGKRLVDDAASESSVASHGRAVPAETHDAGEPLDAGLLVELETSMWRVETRRDRVWMDARLAPEFTEHGRSGRRCTRQECLDLTVGEIDVELPLRDLRLTPLGDGAVLMTYQSVEGRGVANRSSIWRSAPTGWQLVFHQGTPAC